MAVQPNNLRTTNLMKHGKQQTSPFFTINIQRFGTTLRANAVSGKAQSQQLLRSGTVRSILPKDAASVLESEGYTLLDVRPEWEREKARVSGSVHVPLFVEDKDDSPLTLLKKWVHFGYIGLWTGQKFTMMNTEFLEQVNSEFPDKEAKVLLACGEGLRYPSGYGYF